MLYFKHAKYFLKNCKAESQDVRGNIIARNLVILVSFGIGLITQLHPSLRLKE